MRNGRTLVQLAQELERQLSTKKDLVLHPSMMRHETGDQGKGSLVIDHPNGGTFTVTELARRQLAAKLNIPYPYYDRMRKEQPKLLDNNVNTWLQCGEGHAMVRTLDGQARAVLSDRYRRLDNYDLANAVIPILQTLPDMRFESVELTDTRMYLKVVVPPMAYTMEPGDIVQAGVVITNSEVGHGTLSVQPLLYRVVCSNGLIVPDHALRKTHIGRALGTEDNNVQVYQEETLQADDRAFFLKVRDVVQSTVTEHTFKEAARKMQRTMGIKLTGDPVKSVEVLANRYDLNEGERSGVLRHLINGGQLSAYGLVNAVTHFSQEIPNYDRATEFEEIGGKMIEQSPKEWEGLVTAA
ncbi:hypothetical protein DelCs14_1709 [Delftia sp. Cs1-4]|uniref:DUF932 domain-containing protein n=1 Tax=Delftia sp. (strain Cs1-4) TaxID=742013 RepID=UPI00020E7A7E|nr:DUF932 domain-containing protein [Delftia sp. Cs1-4]AEF88738.1 hypothetical protein DelCs14_1709 [Delftia sp. Cs1-4]